MRKQEYQQPSMQVIEVDFEQQMLNGLVTSVTTTGLDADEELNLPEEGLPIEGNLWIDGL